MNSREDYLTYIIKQINTTPYIADEFLKNDDEKFLYRNAFINIKNSLDDFLEGYRENRFMIMQGLRGTGKSTLIFQAYEYLIEKGIDKNRILYLSLDQLKSFKKSDLSNLVDIFVEDIHHRYLATLDEEIFLLVDEAQEDENWSKTGKAIYDQSKKVFMIFTGSNALDLEINLNSVRRTLFERIYPMNFQEYLYLKYGIADINISSDLIDLFLSGNIENASKKETDLLTSASVLKKPLMKEVEYFLSYGGFPLSLNLNEINAHRKIFELIKRVVENDVRHYKAYNGNTKQIIFNILSFMATQKPGGLSVNNLSKDIGSSRSNITELLNILEKTHLIFHIKPYGGASKMIRSPSKYYFLSPTLNASINFTLGKHNPNNRDYLGVLAETYVASTFFRLKNTISKPHGIFAPTGKGMSDFIITTFEGKKVAVEVGIGNKDKSQVKKTMNKYGCDYGIIISSTTNLIKRDGDVIFLPLTTFSLM
ncbi:ATP-binding protein [Methanobrevibacter sp.]|uniref:ATP-binding protein n=1 Tax=Methanobrevibacter sp. TaxID=66852 RepID=UPI003890DCBF